MALSITTLAQAIEIAQQKTALEANKNSATESATQ